MNAYYSVALSLQQLLHHPNSLDHALAARGGYHYLVELVFYVNALDPLERQIGHLMMRGLFYQQIAKQLFLSESTIKVHAQHIFEKMHLKNRRAFEQYVHALIASL